MQGENSLGNVDFMEINFPSSCILMWKMLCGTQNCYMHVLLKNFSFIAHCSYFFKNINTRENKKAKNT